MKYFLVSICLFCQLAGYLQAQQGRQYAYTHYSIINGLASNHVYGVSQDMQGYIWIASINGLQRFDGREFITFRHIRNDPETIPANNVASVYSDKKGRIWTVNEDNSVGIMSTGKFRYKLVPVRRSPPSATLYQPSHFFEDWRGKLFLFIAASGIFELDEIEMEFKPTTSIRIPVNWFVNDIAADFYRECYWIGADSGLARYHPASQQLSYTGHNTIGDAVIEAFKDVKYIGGIVPLRNSNDFVCNSWPKSSPQPFVYVYRATPNKLTQYNLAKTLGVSYHEVQYAFHQKSGPIWVYGLPFAGTLDTARAQFKPLSQLVAQNGMIRFDRANSIFEDRQHNLWLCTTEGIFVFNPDKQPFDSYNLLRPGNAIPKEGPVNSLLQLKDKSVWVGTWGMGLYVYDSLLNPKPVPEAFRKVQDRMTVWYIHQHSKTGMIMIGEQTGRLKCYDPATGKYWDLQPEIFKKSTIRQIAEDKKGNLWFGTQSGMLIKWDYTKSGGNPTRGFEKVMDLILIHRIYTDTDGSLWVATMGKGLFHINPDNHMILDQIGSRSNTGWQLGSDSPIDVLRYNDSLLIVPGFTVTVLNTRKRSSTIISIDEGLPSNTAYYVQKDSLGKIWLGLQNGLCRWNVQNNSFTLFDRRDGIVYDNLTSGGAFCLGKNRIAFSTDHNFVVFDPTQVMSNDRPPKVSLTSIYRMDKRLPIDSVLQIGKMDLDYQRNSVSIDYSTMQYSDHDQLTYYHMLEGLDKDWVRSTSNKAIYNYLPYRSFRFKVKAVNGDGVSSKDITSLLIQVKPPFYRSYWFMALMVFLGIGFLYWLDRLRLQKIRATESIRNRIANSLTDDLTNSLSSINISSELAKTKVDTDAVRTRDFIHHISETSNRMTQALYDMVWSINPQNDQLQKTLERMKQYTVEQENVAETNITIEADPGIRDRQSDMEHRYELLSIFKEAVLNAVKHSGCRNIHVQLRLRKNKLLLLVQDDGKGFDLSTVSLGRGLNDMKRRSEAVSAQLDILSEINTGTLIRLELKLKN